MKICNQELALSTLNVRTLRTEESEVELAHGFEEKKFDILGLSEVSRMSEAIVEKENGDLWRHKRETAGQRGVSFIVKNRIKHLVHEITCVSERIIDPTIKMKRTKRTLVQVYAPTESSSDTELENFYELLETMLHKYKSQRTIAISDFNSKVGGREHGETETVGPYGYGKRNNRGERMVQFAQENRM